MGEKEFEKPYQKKETLLKKNEIVEKQNELQGEAIMNIIQKEY